MDSNIMSAFAMQQPTKESFYAVSKGRKPGIYTTWKDCESQTKGFAGALFKKFKTFEEAVQFIAKQTIESPTACRKARVERMPSMLPFLKKKQECTEESATESVTGSVTDSATEVSQSNKTHIQTSGSAHTDRNESRGESSDQPHTLTVYTDGACKCNGTRRASAGIGVFFGHGDPRNVSRPISGHRQTNNVAELLAIICALETAAGSESVQSVKTIVVYSDSTYAIRCCTDYGEKTRQANYPDATPNVQLIKRAMGLIKKLSPLAVVFEHVAAHTNRKDVHSIGNAEADKLASQACV